MLLAIYYLAYCSCVSGGVWVFVHAYTDTHINI